MSGFENPEQRINPANLLQELFKSDQQDRLDGLMKADEQLFLERDRVRYRKAEELYRIYEKEPTLFSGEMKFDLALLFQHGTNSRDYQKALELAQASVQDGFDGAETLVKVAEDRYLLSIGEPQKWGTQSLNIGEQ